MALGAVPLLHVTVLPGHAQVKLSARQRLRQIFMVSGVESFGVVIGGIAGLLIVNVLQKDPYAVSIFMVACTTLLIGVTDLRLAHCCVPVVGQRGTEVPWAVGSCHPIFSQALTAAFRRARAHRALPLARTRMDRHGLLGSLAGALGVALVQLSEHYAKTVILIPGHISAINVAAFVALILVRPMTPYSTAGQTAATGLPAWWRCCMPASSEPKASPSIGSALRMRSRSTRRCCASTSHWCCRRSSIMCRA